MKLNDLKEGWRLLTPAEKKEIKVELALYLLSTILYVAGMWIIVAKCGWLALLGLMLIIWGSNINVEVGIRKRFKSVMEIILLLRK